MGGNMRPVEIDGEQFPTVGINCKVDKRSGQIIAFGNYLANEPELKEHPYVTFKIAVDISDKADFRHKIINVIGTQGLGTEAMAMLKISMELWNELELRENL
jgi:hypothetical protein